MRFMGNTESRQILCTSWNLCRTSKNKLCNLLSHCDRDVFFFQECLDTGVDAGIGYHKIQEEELEGFAIISNQGSGRRSGVVAIKKPYIELSG